MRTQAKPQSQARCCRTWSTVGDAIRSLPICRAFLNPFASSCKGSSTGCFVLLVTESDCRRPRKVGVRQELVRVSVRAVDICPSFWFRARPAASGVSGGPSLCSGAQVGPKSYVLELRLASVGSERTAVVWLCGPRRASVASDGRAALPPETRRMGQLDSVAATRPIAPPIDGSRRTLSRRRLRQIGQNPTPQSASCGAAASGRSRGTVAATGARTTVTRPTTSDRHNRSTAAGSGGSPHGDRG